MHRCHGPAGISRRALRVLVCAVAALQWAGVAGAQVPGFPSLFPDPLKPSAQQAPGTARSPVAESREKTIERLRAQIAEVNADRARSSAPPADIQPAEVADLEDARTALVTTNEVQIRSLGELDKARVAREAAETVARNWRGFDDKPPYSILLVDELRDAADSARSRIAAIERSGAHIKSEIERYVSETRRAEEALRRAQEAMDRAADVPDRLRATWRRDLAQLRLRAVASRTAATQVLQQILAEELGMRQAELALLTRKVAAAQDDAAFGEADLAKARERLATLAASLKTEQQGVAARIPGRERERDEAQRALDGLRQSTGTPPDQVRIGEARLRAAEAWVTTLRNERDLVEALVTLAEEQSRMWETRRIAFMAPDADERRAAGERLRASASRLARWRGYLDNVTGLQRAALADAEANLLRADAVPGAARYDQDTVAATRRLLGTYERGQDAVQLTVRMFDRWVADIDAEHGSRSFAVRLADNWSSVKGWVRDIWNFELFAVEDAAIVDGREVKTSRGVTVGKSIGAFLVFVLGYWLAASVARRLERGFVARGLDPRRARNYRRWALVGVAAVLALFTLNVARIPVTVFAFLGGALAIGVGFGTQTIIRNFISGLILLAERRIQIGDIIEVDGVTGTVVSVDLRSSTVLGFDGVETAVPNSVLLENKVTNWTQTDRRVRRVVRVGVAYGSPLRDVADVLAECAKRHGVVLDDPAAQVVFEDFGADALVFALYFWVELKPSVNAMQVASDLRFMIARRFAETGIVVAFPQRDIHLDASAPLRVELTPPGAPAAAAAGDGRSP